MSMVSEIKRICTAKLNTPGSNATKMDAKIQQFKTRFIFAVVSNIGCSEKMIFLDGMVASEQAEC